MKILSNNIIIFALCLAVYIFSPIITAKFLAISLLFIQVIRKVEWQTFDIFDILTFSIIYILSFLLTPVAQAVGNHINLTQFQINLMNFGLTITGVLWILIGFQFHFSRDKVKYSVPPVSNNFQIINIFLLLIIFLVALIFNTSLNIDFSYGGDEHYHAISIEICQILLVNLVKNPLTLIFIIAATSSFMFFKQFRIRLATLAIIFLFFIGLAISIVTFSSEFKDPLIYERSLRYPVLEPWLSAVLGAVCFEFWCNSMASPVGVMRLLPLISICFFALILFINCAKILKSNTLALLFTTAICTAPIMLYQAPLLYLEMPIVALIAIIVMDSRRFLGAPSRKLYRTYSFKCAVLLPFLKESGFAIVLFLLVTRFLLSIKKSKVTSPDKTVSRTVLNEIPVWIAVFTPGITYLVLRSLCGYRPYDFHLENFVKLDLWIEGLTQMLNQFGALLGLAFIGLFYTFRNKRYLFVLSLFLLAGLWFYHFFEEPKWIGLARFNLLFIPVFSLLAIYGFHLLRNCFIKILNYVPYLIISFLFIANALMSPIDFQGGRADWGKSGERWYNWTKCLSEIKSANQDASILIGNMSFPYGIGLIFERICWQTQVKQIKPFDEDERQNLLKTLEYAEKEGFEFVIYRYEKPIGNLEVKTMLGTNYSNRFILFNQYPSRAGGLVLFRRMRLDNQLKAL